MLRGNPEVPCTGRVFLDFAAVLFCAAALVCLALAGLPGQGVRAMWAAGGCGLALALLYLARLAVPAWRPALSARLWRGLLLGAVILLPSSLAGADPVASLRLSGMILAALVAAYACVEAFSRAPAGLRSPGAFTVLVTLTGLGALLVRGWRPLAAAQAWYSLAPGDPRGTQPFEHMPSFLSLMAFPLAAQAALSRRGAARAGYTVAAALLALGVVLSGSRAAWVAFGVQGALLAGLTAGPTARRARGILALLGLVFVLAIFSVPGAARRAAATLADPGHGTGGQRLEQWAGAVAVLAEHPVLGTGPGTFPSVFSRRGPDGAAITYPCPHNLYLHVAVECGLPGLFLTLAAAGCVARFALGAGRDGFGRGAVAALAALLAFGLFDL